MAETDDQISSLIKGLKRRNRKAQKTVFLNYYAYVKAITQRYSSNQEDSEELVNDVFVKIFSKINSYDTDYSFKTWLSRITVNTCIDKYRQSLRVIHAQSLDDVFISEMPFTSQEILEEVEVLPIINELPENYRLVFNMYVFEDYSHKEIAEKLNIAEGTSKSCLSRAKKIIKDHMLMYSSQYKHENG